MANSQNFWGNIPSNNNNSNNNNNGNMINQFQQFLSNIQNGGLNNMKGQFANVMNVLQSMNIRTPEQAINFIAQNKGLNSNDLKQMKQMAEQMFNTKF